MKKETKKTVKKDETKEVEVKEPVNETALTDEQLKEIKKAADKSFKTKYTNKKKIATAALCLLGLATIGTVTPIIISNANAKVDVTVKSSNTAMEKYKVKVKKGTKISKIKVVELEGYDFVGFFKDEACTKAYKSSDELKKDATIYASYELKGLKVLIGDKAVSFPLTSNITIGEAIKQIETLEYETSGVVYLDEACTQEADLNAPMTSATTLYTKAATSDKLSFTWDTTTSSWRVGSRGQISGEVVIPASYTDGNHDGKVTIMAIDDEPIADWEGSFGYTNLTSITIPNTVTTIGDYAFYNCTNLTSITIPNSVITIGKEAFYGCRGLTNATIGSSVETIGDRAFSGCSGLTKATIGSSVETIGVYAFYNCTNLTSITIPNSVTTIGNQAFSGCSGLTSATIGSSVETIGDRAFSVCSGLTEITIPKSVTTIGKLVFGGCSGLTSITVEAGNTKYHSSGNCIIETASKTLIQGCNTSTIPTDGSVTTIGESAFSGCSGITSITIPNSVTTIGESAFSDCRGITSITIPNSVTTINGVFSGCSGITSITIPNSVTTIGKGAFVRCSSLTSITIPNSVKTIGQNAFGGCSDLTSITIPNSVTTIGDYAFGSCSGLTSITLGNSVTRIATSAFEYCSGLTSITVEEGNTKYHSSGNCLIETASKTLILGCKTSIIPTDGSVTTIGEYAFYCCENLTSITIPSSVTTIGNYVFDYCSGLKTVIIDSSTIANTLNYYDSNGGIINNEAIIYIKTGLSTSNSIYLTSNFTKQATSDKDGYDMWVRK